MFHGLSEIDPSLKRAINDAKAKEGFLEFCRQECVQLTGMTAEAEQMPYQGDSAQDHEYAISVDEFSRFVKTYGFEVKHALPPVYLSSDTTFGSSEYESADQASPNSGEELSSKSSVFPELISGKVARVGFHNDVLHSDTDPDGWGAEFEASFAASEAKNKERLKKKSDHKILQQPTPGALPNTRIGRLAVRIAWEIEVKSGQQATCKEVMDRLCKLAETGNESDSLYVDVDCLVDADTSVLGKEKVRWRTKGGEKWYGQNTCKGTLTAWHKSLSQKTR